MNIQFDGTEIDVSEDVHKLESFVRNIMHKMRESRQGTEDCWDECCISFAELQPAFWFGREGDFCKSDGHIVNKRAGSLALEDFNLAPYAASFIRASELIGQALDLLNRASETGAVNEEFEAIRSSLYAYLNKSP